MTTINETKIKPEGWKLELEEDEIIVEGHFRPHKVIVANYKGNSKLAIVQEGEDHHCDYKIVEYTEKTVKSVSKEDVLIKKAVLKERIDIHPYSESIEILEAHIEKLQAVLDYKKQKALEEKEPE